MADGQPNQGTTGVSRVPCTSLLPRSKSLLPLSDGQSFPKIGPKAQQATVRPIQPTSRSSK